MDPKEAHLTSKQLRAHFGGVSDMCLWRWQHDPELKFPEPMRINGRRYWKVADIEAWQAAQNEATPSRKVA